MRTIFDRMGGFSDTGWGILKPADGEEEGAQGFADTGWGLLKTSPTSAVRRPQYARALFGSGNGLKQARIDSPSMGQFDFPGFDLPEFPAFPPAPAPAPVPAPPVVAPPAEPRPRVEFEPVYAFPVGINVACPAGDGTFTILNGQTGVVVQTGVAAIPTGMQVLPPTDPRCAGMVRAASAEPTPKGEGVSSTTIILAGVASALAIGVVVLLAQK